MKPERVTSIYSSAVPWAALHSEVNNGVVGGETRAGGGEWRNSVLFRQQQAPRALNNIANSTGLSCCPL